MPYDENGRSPSNTEAKPVRPIAINNLQNMALLDTARRWVLACRRCSYAYHVIIHLAWIILTNALCASRRYMHEPMNIESALDWSLENIVAITNSQCHLVSSMVSVHGLSQACHGRYASWMPISAQPQPPVRKKAIFHGFSRFPPLTPHKAGLEALSSCRSA